MKPLYLLTFFVFLFACKKKEIDPIKTDPIIVEPVKPELPKVLTNPFSDLTRYSVKITGIVADTGRSNILEAGFVVDTIAGPTISRNLNKFLRTPSANGEMLVIITNIPAGKTYFLKAFATNKQGTGYGEEIKFNSQQEKVFQGQVVLSNQGEVNDFGKQKYNRIDGSLSITGTVTDLSPLKNLIAIDFGLYVRGTQNLTSLRGLDSLEMINRAHFFHGVYIEDNASLKDLWGLDKVTSSNGIFYIRNNKELTDLHGLKNLTSSQFGEFRIDKCDKLTSLNGLEKLAWLDGSILLKDNQMLSDIRALRGLSFLTGRITIINNPALKSLEGFESLTKTEGVELFDNEALVSLNGLNNLVTTDFIVVGDNPVLSDLSALLKVSKTDYITIENSPAILNMEGFKNITEVGRTIRIYNSGLLNFSGLENLTTTQSIEVIDNKYLKNFIGLNSLKSLNENAYSLIITRNAQLSSFAGLENLTSAAGSIQVFDNPQLENFCGLRPLLATGWAEWFWAEENLTNPDKNKILSSCK